MARDFAEDRSSWLPFPLKAFWPRDGNAAWRLGGTPGSGSRRRTSGLVWRGRRRGSCCWARSGDLYQRLQGRREEVDRNRLGDGQVVVVEAGQAGIVVDQARRAHAGAGIRGADG